MSIKNKDVDDYILNAKPSQIDILTRLRSWIFETFDPINESFKWKRPVYGTQKDFCYLVCTKSTVNLGFYDATNINDPHHWLEGTGKKMRHIKIKQLDDYPKETIQKMLEEAEKTIHA